MWDKVRQILKKDLTFRSAIVLMVREGELVDSCTE